MTHDALDPGFDYTFPNVPRDADGFIDEQRMPVGFTRQRGLNGATVLIDQTPTVRDRHGQLRPVTDVVPRRPTP